MTNTEKKTKVTESFTHYPTNRPDELTLRTDDRRNVTVGEDDFTRNNVAQAGEVSEQAIKARLRLLAEQKLEGESGEEQA